MEETTRRLAALEADCCGSLTWTVVTADEVHLLLDGEGAHSARLVLIYSEERGAASDEPRRLGVPLQTQIAEPDLGRFE